MRPTCWKCTAEVGTSHRPGCALAPEDKPRALVNLEDCEPAPESAAPGSPADLAGWIARKPSNGTPLSPEELVWCYMALADVADAGALPPGPDRLRERLKLLVGCDANERFVKLTPTERAPEDDDIPDLPPYEESASRADALTRAREWEWARRQTRLHWESRGVAPGTPPPEETTLGELATLAVAEQLGELNERLAALSIEDGPVTALRVMGWTP